MKYKMAYSKSLTTSTGIHDSLFHALLSFIICSYKSSKCSWSFISIIQLLGLKALFFTEEVIFQVKVFLTPYHETVC